MTATPEALPRCPFTGMAAAGSAAWQAWRRSQHSGTDAGNARRSPPAGLRPIRLTAGAL